MKLSELAEALGATLVGDGAVEVTRPVAPQDAECATDLALILSREAVAALAGSKARAGLVAQGIEIVEGRLAGHIVVGRPRVALVGLTRAFDIPVHDQPGIHETAVVAEGARLGDGVSLGPFVYVGPGAQIGPGTRLLNHASVGANARLGARCLIHPGARIGDRVRLGDRVIVHHNASIGADGFAFVTPEPGSVEAAKSGREIEATNDEILRINSLGTVVLGDDVEIGACSAIDRATIDATIVGRNTKIDDLVAVGHNCRIGENCMICGQVGLAGSTVIGDRVVLAGQVGVADHITIGSDSVVGAASGVASDVPPRSIMLGYPAIPRKRALEAFHYSGRLKSLFRDVRDLGRRLAALEGDREKR